MYYYGITIGPIIETISKASTPASLWYASYIFSDITRKICEELTNRLKETCHIIAPYYTEEREYDGVGHYHDRVIFYVDELENQVLTEEQHKKVLEYIKESIESVKDQLAQQLASDLKINEEERVIRFINNYIEIHYVAVRKSEIGEENPIKYISNYLDTLELNLNINGIKEKDYFQTLFNGKENAANVYIRECTEVKLIREQGQDFNLLSDNGIRELADIASVNQETESSPKDNLLKKYRYYAIVQADGDNIGKLLRGIAEKSKEGVNEKTKDFSEACYQYTSESAKLIKAYKGVPIYAGGDDLLFIAPIENLEGENIFELCQKISGEFNRIFEKYTHYMPEGIKLGVSFGIAIHHRKYPLYEAFQDARDLLFKEAKERKNSMAVKLHKSSGQVVGFVADINCSTLGRYKEILKAFYRQENTNETKEESRVLKSVIYQMEKFIAVFKFAFQDKERIEHIFKNMFAHEKQQVNSSYIDKIRDLSTCITEDIATGKLKALMDEGQYLVQEDAEDSAKVLTVTTLLRIAKFLVEGGI